MLRKIGLQFFLACLAACSSSTERSVATGLPDTGPPALHALHNRKLHELMTAMNNLVFDNLRTQIELDQERRRKAEQIAASADALSKAVDAIPATLPALNLDPAEQAIFLALAKKLRSQTALLVDEARQNQIDAISVTWNQLASTCTACHGLYRGLKH